MPEQTYVKNNSQKKEIKSKEKIIKSLGIAVIDHKDSKGVMVNKVDNDDIRLQKGDIILEVNRELVDSSISFISIIEKYKKTGRSSLLLRIQRDDETSWVTIKFISN